MRDPERVDADRLPGAEAFAARDLEPALDPRDGDLGRIGGDAELPDALQRAPFAHADRRSRVATS